MFTSGQDRGRARSSGLQNSVGPSEFRYDDGWTKESLGQEEGGRMGCRARIVDRIGRLIFA
jgi:hypothetical protein